MSIEEKARAYDEALAKAKKYMKDGYTVLMPDLFPELKETEDERMARVIGLALTDVPEERFASLEVNLKDCLDYLEKKKEEGHDGKKWIYEDDYRKDMDRSFNDGRDEVLEHPEKYGLQKEGEWRFPYGKDETVDRLMSIAECLEMDGDCLFNGYKGTECGKLLRDLARKQIECKTVEWNEEDEKMLKWLCGIVHSQRVNKVITLKEESDLGKWIDKWINHNPCLREQKDDKCISPEEGDIVVNKYGEISVFESWGHHPDGGSFNDRSYFFAKCVLVGDNYDDCDCCPDSAGLRYATPKEIRKIIPYLLKERV